MNDYSIASDFKKETIDAYEKLNKTYQNARVVETYGSITVGSHLQSGRATSQLQKVDLYELKDYIEYSKNN